MDRTTALLAAARFTSAIARLCLGPLLPILSLSLKFSEESKPALLSAYSSGYLLTQMVGGYLADRHGYARIVSATVGVSAFILFYISTFATTTVAWTRALFCLGLVAGPLFPAGSAAISSNVRADRRAASFAIVDAAASAGTTVASLAPIVAYYMGWRFIYLFTAVILLFVAVGIITSMQSNTMTKKTSSSMSYLAIQTCDQPKNDNVKSDDRSLKAIRVLFLPVAVCTYLCHCCDNFTKYSINSWAATMLVNGHEASPALVSGILAGQEATSVVSKLLVGTLFSFSSNTMSSTSLFVKRGAISALGFLLQGVALWSAFQANTACKSGFFFIISAIAAGSHSVGFRPIYLEVAPHHAGAISGFGNSVASCASVLGPLVIGSCINQNNDVEPFDASRSENTFQNGAENRATMEDWSRVAFYMILANLSGSLAALCITYMSRQRQRQKLRKEDSV